MVSYINMYEMSCISVSCFANKKLPRGKEITDTIYWIKSVKNKPLTLQPVHRFVAPRFKQVEQISKEARNTASEAIG